MKSKHVCQIYELLRKNNLVSFPLTKDAQNKLDAIVATITGMYFGEEIYKTHEEKAVAYLYFLIKDHPFTDGNKRTATLTFEVVCDINGLKPNYGSSSLDALAVYIEKIREREHHVVIKLLNEFLFG